MQLCGWCEDELAWHPISEGTIQQSGMSFHATEGRDPGSEFLQSPTYQRKPIPISSFKPLDQLGVPLTQGKSD